jgi:hypothetical protein
MKRTLFLVFNLLLLECLNAQTRYLDQVFSDVTIQTDVVYGVNATVLYYSVFGEAVPEMLKMDIYTPADDTATSRPLMLYFHTGNFFPHPQNGGTGGTKSDSSAVEICTRFAKMGYVVASCDYRLGWNPIDTTQEGRVNTLINAIYRGVQDCRTAVRYFRKSVAEMNNTYGIDPTRIVTIGQGTGGNITLANAGLDVYEDLLLPKFFGSNGIPMVIEIVNGNLDGTTYGINPLTGDTLCYRNHLGYPSDVSATVNLGGALGDASWFDESDGPLISFQSPTDPFAPYGNGMVIVPGFNLNVVEMSGSLIVQQLATENGNNAVFATIGNGINDPFPSYTAAATLHNEGNIGLFPFVRPASQPYDSAPWEWWANTNPNNANGLAVNPDMSAMKGRTFCDTIVKFAAPRLYLALQNAPNGGSGSGWIISGCTDANACNYNPNAEQNNGTCKYLGQVCNDGQSNTINDVINSQCVCTGIPLTPFGCTNPQACNFNPSANQDNGSCLVIGSTCNDGNNATVNDIVGSSCTCAGTPTDLNGNNENTYQGLFYQAVARNADGTPMANQNISIRFSLHQSSATGAIEYQEVQNVNSNALGLFTTFFGTGQAVIGNFNNVQWGVNAKYLQVEMNLNGWQSIGTQQLAAVPYAIRAKEVDPSGLKLQSPNGNCYILQVNNNGSLSTLQVPCD